MESAFKWPIRHKQIIPPDITFQFEGDENEIHAHKWMMGMVSPVFNKMFFVVDTTDMYAKKLLIKGTTFGAFNIMKNAIYDITSMQNSLKGKSLLEVFSVLDLVTRYQISELQQAVRNQLASFTLTDDNVLKVAAYAKEESSTFEDEAQEVFLRCAKFLEHKLENARAVFKYVADHKDEKDIVYELLALINDIPCSNCNKPATQVSHNSGTPAGPTNSGNTSSNGFASPSNLNLSKQRPRSGSFDSFVWNGGYKAPISSPTHKPFKPGGLLITQNKRKS